MRRRLFAMPSLSRKDDGRKKQGRRIVAQNRLARKNCFARRNQLRRLLFAQKMRVQFGRMRQRKRRGKMQSMFTISMRKNRKHARTLRRIQKEMQKIMHTRRIRNAGKIIFQERRKSAKIKIRCLKNFAERNNTNVGANSSKASKRYYLSVQNIASFGAKKGVFRGKRYYISVRNTVSLGPKDCILYP